MQVRHFASAHADWWYYFYFAFAARPAGPLAGAT